MGKEACSRDPLRLQCARESQRDPVTKADSDSAFGGGGGAWDTTFLGPRWCWCCYNLAHTLSKGKTHMNFQAFLKETKPVLKIHLSFFQNLPSSTPSSPPPSCTLSLFILYCCYCRDLYCCPQNLLPPAPQAALYIWTFPSVQPLQLTYVPSR